MKSHTRAFFIALLALLIFGVLLVYDVSVVYALSVFGNKYYFLFKQIIWVAVGLAAFFVFSKINLKLLKKLSLPLMLASLVCLVLVLIPGVGSKLLGARRWLGVGELSFQPAELAKLSFIIYFSFWAKKLKDKKSWLPFLGLFGILMGLVLLQPDLGTALVAAAVGAGMYFISGAPLKHFIIMVPLVAIFGLGFILISPYRRNRLITYLTPQSVETSSSGYHTKQALIAIGSGSIFGVGPGKSRQKYAYLPEVTTDSIFAIFCEEFGFLGALCYLGVLGYLVFSGFRIALKTKEFEYRLLAAGITLWLAAQSALNLGAISGLFPLTGVPLPLVSYGGSAIIFLMAGMGLVINVSGHS